MFTGPGWLNIVSFKLSVHRYDVAFSSASKSVFIPVSSKLYSSCFLQSYFNSETG